MSSSESLGKLCQQCKGQCCKHVALEIDKPTCKKDYDNIRWYLMHKNVEVFIDNDGGWNIKFSSHCEHLEKNGQCGIYETRPKICRDYPGKDEACEYAGETEYYQQLFSNAKEFEHYLSSRNIDWRFRNLS
jgi:uncharacterized protein